MPDQLLIALQKKFPFISIVEYGSNGDEFIGIIQNSDNAITCLYDFGSLKDEQEKRLFLELGEKWYYESNRMLPINIYLKDEWEPFQKTFKTLVTKEVNIVHGPSTSLSSLVTRRKHRSVLVIRKPT